MCLSLGSSRLGATVTGAEAGPAPPRSTRAGICCPHVGFSFHRAGVCSGGFRLMAS